MRVFSSTFGWTMARSKVLTRQGIRIEQAGRHEFVVPRFLLDPALPHITDGEEAGDRIRDMRDEAGLLSHEGVQSRGHLVAGRWIQAGGGSSDRYSPSVSWFWLCGSMLHI